MAGVERVLIYRLGSLGDMVVALPALHLVARAFPQAERRLLTNFPVAAKAPAAAAVLEGTGTVAGYVRYAAGTRRPDQLARVWWAIARWRPQVLVYLGSARGVASAERDARFFRMCGVDRLVGVPLTETMQENLKNADDRLEFEAARLARNVAELGDAHLDDAASWNLRLTPKETARADEALARVGARPMLAVCVGTKVQAKDWGQENWRTLLERLAAEYPWHALVLVGASEEHAASESAAEGWRSAVGPKRAVGPVLNLCGLLTPRESAAALARARLFVGHDSGPMHLAAAVGTPCVAIFAARNLPRVWFPYGPGHRVVYHPVECAGCGLDICTVEKKRCLTSISVDEVMAEVRQAMAGAGGG